MPQLQHLQAAELDAIVAALDRDGACIVTDYLDASTCQSLAADFQPHLDELDWGVDDLGYRNDFYGSQTKRLHGLFDKSGTMADVLMHPLMDQLTRRFFVESQLARDVRLSNAELMVLGSNQGVQTFHTDAASWRRAQAKESDEILLSVNIALTPFTASNGATRVVPGSHRWEAGREPAPEEVCQAEMPAGAALVYTGNVIHSGGANHEESTRTGLYLGYIPSWLRPIENHLVTNRLDAVMALPPAARVLLDVSPGGFTVYA